MGVSSNFWCCLFILLGLVTLIFKFTSVVHQCGGASPPTPAGHIKPRCLCVLPFLQLIPSSSHLGMDCIMYGKIIGQLSPY